ncbi:hypothetical protein HanXRQr2_Chr10g0444531 [Helianthus annuus]|uniref:Uncharacterized protein n=1 Tax=Helianthus annuus TaxID=4232 RepID=A0A251UIJ8_HELAN|nr:hypothetical protein HanXRQr2_Chr10g0444531 [Helianthus annuus]KAJ0875509.1 hypothetical protein HanPSC8_Chr11g0477251 [Helianthus annuus]KAJ0952417.1 hypothetical protein HanPSC8_Chr02g0071961 [Helianthus annuus]
MMTFQHSGMIITQTQIKEQTECECLFVETSDVDQERTVGCILWELKTPRIGLYEASKGLRIGPSYRPRLPV